MRMRSREWPEIGKELGFDAVLLRESILKERNWLLLLLLGAKTYRTRGN